MIRSSLWKDETLTLDLEESHQRLSMNTSPTLNDSTAWNHMRKIQSVMYMIALALRVFFYFRQIWKRDFFIRTSLLCMASYYSMLTCWQFVDSVHLHVLIRMTVKGSNPLLSLRGILCRSPLPRHIRLYREPSPRSYFTNVIISSMPLCRLIHVVFFVCLIC